MAQIFDRVAVDHWLQDEIIRKFPPGGLGDISLGSPLIVNPGETAVFVRGGRALGTFGPGTHILTTANVPFLTDLVERGLFGGKNVFTADVYFVKTTDVTLKWGTASPIIVEHPNRSPGASAIAGNGSYVIKVEDPWRFLNAMDAFRESVLVSQLKDRLDPMLGVMMQDKLSELAMAKNLGPAELQSFSQDLNSLLVGLLQGEFDGLGMNLVDFNIRLALHPNSLEVVTRMGYGTTFSQMRMADATLAAAENPSGGGGSLGELGLGMMGMSAAMQQQQQWQQQQAAQAGQQQPATGGSAEIPAVLTPQQVAEIIQVSEEDIIAAIEAGDLKARKIGNAYRISRANLEEFLSG